ncbi:MAG: transcriptional repressor [Gammaproteobacteria bacterium 28-57-27]|nr:MAG: transcriptional repressor [Gammaproteobacteria bacterium 28-57-27]
MPHCNHHTHCLAQALDHAETLCRSHGARLTPLRRRVFELVCASHSAVKAYDLIDRLSTEDHLVKPPTVYRALDFLLEHGLIHRVDSLNAFVGCTSVHNPSDVRLLICTACGEVSELIDPTLDVSMTLAIRTSGFQASHTHLEIHGLCAHCQHTTTQENATP